MDDCAIKKLERIPSPTNTLIERTPKSVNPRPRDQILLASNPDFNYIIKGVGYDENKR